MLCIFVCCMCAILILVLYIPSEVSYHGFNSKLSCILSKYKINLQNMWNPVYRAACHRPNAANSFRSKFDPQLQLLAGWLGVVTNVQTNVKSKSII